MLLQAFHHTKSTQCIVNILVLTILIIDQTVNDNIQSYKHKQYRQFLFISYIHIEENFGMYFEIDIR